jgi:hypothetical protein
MTNQSPLPINNPELVTSSADYLAGFLNTGGKTKIFGPVGLLAGSAPGSLDKAKKLASFNHTYTLNPTDSTNATLAIGAANLSDDVTSAGISNGTIGIHATADLASGNIVLTDNPLSTLSVLGLSVGATLVHAESDASYVFGDTHGTLSGAASFGDLTISGGLIGKTLTFKGDAAANTILFHNSTVTITLDRQILSDFDPPGATAPSAAALQPVTPTVLPNRITTDAITISLNKAEVFGQTVSGMITFGETSASLFPPLHS